MAQVLETPEQASIADGATAIFPIAFSFEAASEVKVAVLTAAGVRTIQTVDVDYVVSGTNLVFQTGHLPPDQAQVQRWRETAVEQPIPFGDDATFRPTANENSFDSLTRMVQEERARGRRALAVPIGETPLQLLPAAVRRNGVAVFADTAAAPLIVLDVTALQGTGGVENALIELAQPEQFGASSTDLARVQAAVTLARETRLAGDYAVSAAVEVPDGRTVSGSGTLAADPVHDDRSLMRLGAGVRLVGPLVLDGSDLPVPTADWFSGEPIGGGVFVTGTDADNRIEGASIDGVTFRDMPSGAVYESFVYGGTWGDVRFENLQTYTGHATAGGYGVQYGRDRSHGTLVFDGYTRKALNLGYCDNFSFVAIESTGGVSGHSAIHTVGGTGQFYGRHRHRGVSPDRSYGAKYWATHDIWMGPCDYSYIEGGIQFYGASGYVEFVKGRDSTGALLLADSLGAAAQAGAVTDMVVGGADYANAAATNDIDKVALNIRADPDDDCPTRRVDVGAKQGVMVRKCWGGARSSTVGGKTDVITLTDWDVGDLGSSGYPFYLEGRTIVLRRPKLRAGCNNGLIAFTNALSRGGELIIEDMQIDPGAVTTSEPIIRVGYPSLFEAGFKRISILGVSGDLGGEALAKLISIHANTMDQLEWLEIDGVSVTNAVLAEQVLIALNASGTTKPGINLGAASVTDANGVQLGCTITGGALIEFGKITHDWLLPIAGRSAKAIYTPANTVASGITAFAGGGAASAVAITTKFVRVATVATTADSLKLPAALPGGEHIIANRGANALQLFGVGSDTVNGVAAGTGIAVAADAIAHAVCIESGKWEVRA